MIINYILYIGIYQLYTYTKMMRLKKKQAYKKI